jgi:pimeloyl-ACP methyl ester carboxylesterase
MQPWDERPVLASGTFPALAGRAWRPSAGVCQSGPCVLTGAGGGRGSFPSRCSPGCREEAALACWGSGDGDAERRGRAPAARTGRGDLGYYDTGPAKRSCWRTQGDSATGSGRSATSCRGTGSGWCGCAASATRAPHRLPGTSAWPITPGNVACLLDALGSGAAHWVGHSTSCLIGLQLAQDRPDLWRATACWSPPPAGICTARPTSSSSGDGPPRHGGAIRRRRSDRRPPVRDFVQACREAADTQKPEPSDRPLGLPRAQLDNRRLLAVLRYPES